MNDCPRAAVLSAADDVARVHPTLSSPSVSALLRCWATPRRWKPSAPCDAPSEAGDGFTDRYVFWAFPLPGHCLRMDHPPQRLQAWTLDEVARAGRAAASPAGRGGGHPSARCQSLGGIAELIYVVCHTAGAADDTTAPARPFTRTRHVGLHTPKPS